MSIFANMDGRIHCIFGSLDDMVCTNDLRIVKFNDFFSSYLKSAGYDCVVFYLSQGRMRTFDAITAKKLIGSNFTSDDSDDNTDTDIPDEYEYEDEDDDGLVFDYESPGDTEPSEEKQNKRLKYTAYVTGADFIPTVQQLMSDKNGKHAVIFENIRDFLNVNAECSDQFKTILHYMRVDVEESKKSMVIFQSLSQDYSQILMDMQENDILLSNFFHHNGQGESPEERRFFRFSSPRIDEIANLLERYRLFGNKRGTRLNYPVEKLRGYAFLIEKASQLASSSKLDNINRSLQDLMAQYSGSDVNFSEAHIRSMYPNVTVPQLPMDRIHSIRGTHCIYARMRALELMHLAEKEKSAHRNCYEIGRMGQKEYNNSKSSCRFLLKGTSHTNRSLIANAIADHLYVIGEVAENPPFPISGDMLRTVLARGDETQLRYWIRECKGNSLLIIDDIDALLDDVQNGPLLVSAFHRIFLEELNRNKSLHFILIIHESRIPQFFGKNILAQYEIPEKNQFRCDNPCSSYREDPNSVRFGR